MKARKPMSLALDTSLVQDQAPAEVVPRVFIGSIHSAFALDALLSLKITHVKIELFLLTYRLDDY
jgi:hypothetical protein